VRRIHAGDINCDGNQEEPRLKETFACASAERSPQPVANAEEFRERLRRKDAPMYAEANVRWHRSYAYLSRPAICAGKARDAFLRVLFTGHRGQPGARAGPGDESLEARRIKIRASKQSWESVRNAEPDPAFPAGTLR